MNRNYLIGHIRMHTGSYAWLQAMWVWDRKRKYGLCQKSLWDPDKMSVPSIIIPNFDSYTFFSGDLPNQLIEKTETPFTVKLVYKQMGMSNLLEFEATKDDRGITYVLKQTLIHSLNLIVYIRFCLKSLPSTFNIKLY